MEKLRYFSKKDNFGNFNKMDKGFLKILDRTRHLIRQSCNVLIGFTESSSNSEHSKNPCSASDDYFSKRLLGYKVNSKDMGIAHLNLDHLILRNQRSILEIIILKYLSGIKRIGIYPYEKPRTHFHNDLKKSKTDFWIGLTISSLIKQISEDLEIAEENLEFILNQAKLKSKNKLYIYPK